MPAPVALDHDQRVPRKEQQPLVGQPATPQEEEERDPERRSNGSIASLKARGLGSIRATAPKMSSAAGG